jgi:hypothetical protein
MVPMARRRRSIIMLLAALSLTAAEAIAADRMTEARQNYAYDPRTESVTLDLTTVYSGIDAERFRDLYRQIGADGYSKAKLDYYRGMYGNVAQATPLALNDNRDTIETRERYTFSLANPDDDDLKHRFPIYPDLLRGFFAQLPPTIERPYPLDSTLDRRDIVTVSAPTLGTYAIRDADISDGYFAFTRKTSTGSGHIKMDYRLRFLADSVPVAEFAAYSADIERMDHNIFAWIDLDRDFYHRHYRDIPTMIRGAAATLVLAGAVLGWWLFRKRTKSPVSPR